MIYWQRWSDEAADEVQVLIVGLRSGEREEEHKQGEQRRDREAGKTRENRMVVKRRNKQDSHCQPGYNHNMVYCLCNAPFGF